MLGGVYGMVRYFQKAGLIWRVGDGASIKI
jgi:hypothetical protein